MKTIYIDATELKAVRVFAAKQDIRYYLNGVLVQATAKETRIVGTDGTIVGVFDREQQNEGVTFDELIIPTDVIDALKPDAKFPVRVTIDAGQFRIQQYDDRAFTFNPADGRFPDYTRTVPQKVSGEAAQFAGDLLGRIDKAQKIVDKKRTACIWHNGPTDAALFGLIGADRFIGVVMPLTHDPKSRKPLPVPDTSSFRRALTAEKAPATQPDTAEELL
jgi:DNA polymerase-3 subunit beta